MFEALSRCDASGAPDDLIPAARRLPHWVERCDWRAVSDGFLLCLNVQQGSMRDGRDVVPCWQLCCHGHPLRRGQLRPARGWEREYVHVQRVRWAVHVCDWVLLSRVVNQPRGRGVCTRLVLRGRQWRANYVCYRWLLLSARGHDADQQPLRTG